MQDPSIEITAILQAINSGQPGALDRLFALVYDELRKIAKNRVDRSKPCASEPTTLVHEAYLRLVRKENVTWSDRHHFFWAAARAMSDILAERARRDKTTKRGGDLERIELHDDLISSVGPPDFLDLKAALERLETIHPTAAKVIGLQFFAGLKREEIAEILNLSPSAVWRESSFARAWLKGQLDSTASDEKNSP
jgi:RNA polymerase sigma factor (TIGR02999 family)